MSNPFAICSGGFCRRLALALLLATACCARADLLQLDSVGARGGFAWSDNAHDFHQAEFFANLNLPWRWDLGAEWKLQTRLDLSAGWLGDPGTDSFIATVGPSLVAHKPNFPLSFDAGVSPTYISEWEFRGKNFGIPLQFSSHIGVSFEVWRHFSVGYRFQHMSNAGFDDHNPGLNLHMVSIGWRF